MQQLDQFRDQIMSKEIGSLIIPFQNVITVRSTWNLEKALSKLMESGWSSVPVLNEADEVEGVISKSEILEYARMEKVPYYLDFRRKFVHDAMKQNVPMLSDDTILRYGIELLVDWPYLPIVNHDRKFIGILTRRSVLDYLLKEFYEAE
ncbi:CBS domain-containing protein [Tepidibacillus fermentans]|uniref:CBS domain protein n=1 Tax=Tepidibacillus fermentans TaxID=1281767 RepID=A0A4R3KK93_9BACI|nr:CBS domain-containing protein [Tepidibacillus fermentans]TCS83140.1 CBS domain protein [Tepidibacillus fermentans]